MEHMLAARDKLLSAMQPGAHPGQAFWLDVQFTNHGPVEAAGVVEPVGWT
jgi:hypothetical protein